MKHFCHLKVKELLIYLDLNFKLKCTEIPSSSVYSETSFSGRITPTPDQRSSVKANLIISSRWNGGKLPLPLQRCKFQALPFGPRNTFLSKADGAHTVSAARLWADEHLRLLSTEIKVSVGIFSNNCIDISGAYCNHTPLVARFTILR